MEDLDHFAFGTPKRRLSLLDRMTALLGTTTLYNDAPVAEALHDLALAAIRQSRDGCAAGRYWERANDGWMTRLGRTLADLLAQGKDTVLDLPGGGTARGNWHLGQVTVGIETLALDIDRPGLHPLDQLPVLAGSNLDLLLGELARLSAGQPVTRLGPPLLVAVREADEVVHVLQWTFHDEAGTPLLVREVHASRRAPLCTASPSSVCMHAVGTIERLGWFWGDRKRIAAWAAQARAAGYRIAAREEEVELDAVVYDLGSRNLQLQFAAWGPACRRDLVVSTIEEDEEVEDHWGPDCLTPAAQIRELHATGAEGRITGFAKAVVEAAPEGVAAVLARLATAYETSVTLPTPAGPLRFDLEWRYGVIAVASAATGGLFSVCYWIMHFPGVVVPGVVAATAAGRRLDEVFTMPFRCDAGVAAITMLDTSASVTLALEFWLVDCSRGRIWRRATDDLPF